MRYLGIDYGEKRVGIAVSDEGGSIAFPRDTIVNNAHLLDELKKVIAGERIESVVVGDTRAFSGFENTVTKEAEAFIERLQAATGLPVFKSWEAGSSIEASRYAPEDEGHSDGAAAAIILQRYIDMKGNSVR